MTTETNERAILILDTMPAGYPSADARDWDEFKRAYRAAAQAKADRLGKSVEVHDTSDVLIEVVEPSGR